MGSDKTQFYFEISGYETEFRVISYGGTEAMSQLFHFEVYLASENDELTFEDIIGKPATLMIGRGGETRFVNGMVSRFWWIGEGGEFKVYYAEFVPVIWLLTQRYECRIFQDLSVPDIIQNVLKDGGITAEFYNTGMLRKKYPAREYAVQYRESDFNFISRLMEEEGIFYYFEHHYESGKRRRWHTLVMGDDPSCHPAIHGKPEVLFHEATGQVPTEEFVYEYRYGNQTRPGAVMLRDFNYERPTLDLQGAANASQATQLEIYDYPGEFDTPSAGNTLAKIRLEEMQAQYKMGSGQSNCCRLTPGSSFTLKDHPQEKFNQKYLVVSVIHAGSRHKETQEEPLGGLDKVMTELFSRLPLPSIGPFSPLQIYSNLKNVMTELFGKDEKFVYTNSFVCIPFQTPYRPPRLTPKPVIQGPQTALVVGVEKDEKLHMDELGRAKVKFHWDREPKDDGKRTCYIRVAYNYAGTDHGVQVPPLVGDEVVVDFLEGDPDKPLIIGAVYNRQNLPPLNPENKIENILLTPYQHRLLLSDRNASITLNTGGKEVIEMTDGEEGTEFGKEISISTADKHNIHLCKGTRVSGIKIETEKGQRLAMFDEPHPAGILLQDMGKNLSIQFNSDEKIILIRNTSDQRIQIECKLGQVQVIGGGVEVAGGSVRINGSSQVEITSAGSVTIKAPKIDLEAPTINLTSPIVNCSGVVKCDVLVSNSVVATTYTPGIGNIK